MSDKAGCQTIEMKKTFFFLNDTSGEMAQWFRVLIALAEYPNPVPSIHKVNRYGGDPVPSSGLGGSRMHMWYTHKQKNTQTHKN